MIFRLILSALLLQFPAHAAEEICAQLYARLFPVERAPVGAFAEVNKLLKSTEELAKEEPHAFELEYLRALVGRARGPITPELVQEVVQANKALEARSKLRELAAKALTGVWNTAKFGARQWKYLVAVEATQLGAEAYSRRDSFSSSNPIIIAKEMLTNSELIQNIAFMTNETFWMSGISSTPGHGPTSMSKLIHALKMCAVVALVDSTAMNVIIKGEPDKGRIAIDTGWEMLVGSVQTQIDLGAIKAFENLALKTGRQRFKLLGYVAVFADQTAGFLGYSHLTQWYENKQRTESREQARQPSNEEPPLRVFKREDVRLVPIYGPQ